jgi:hypothetical protein
MGENMKNKLLSILLLAMAVNSKAESLHNGDNYYEMNSRYFVKYHDYQNCISEYIIKIDEKERPKSSCKLDQALQLAWTTQNYPNLKENPRRVQYWEGGYSKVIELTNTYLRELVDECRGKIISGTKIVDKEDITVRYSVLNPNLSDSITESFMLVPMTQEEAKQELVEAQKRCLASK